MKYVGTLILALNIIFSVSAVAFASNEATKNADIIYTFNSKNATTVYAEGTDLKKNYKYIFDMKFATDSTVNLHVQNIECYHFKESGFDYKHFAYLDTNSAHIIEDGKDFSFTCDHPFTNNSINNIEFVMTAIDKNGNQTILRNSFNVVYDLSPNEIKDIVRDTNTPRDSNHDLTRLRYNADYEIDVFENVYWVPTRILGDSRYTNEDIRGMVNKEPEEKQNDIGTLYEALQLYQLSNFTADGYNIKIKEGNITWEHPEPGYHAVRINNGCCTGCSNWLNYILKDDYDEIGFIYTIMPSGGHVFNYIKDNDWYYFIDMTKYTAGVVGTAFESGDMSDYKNSDYINGNLHKTKSISSYVEYILRDYHEPPALVFMYTASDTITGGYLGTLDNMIICYEKRNDINILYFNSNTSINYDFSSYSPTTRPDWTSR